VETNVMELQFNGGPSSLNNVSLQSFGFDNTNGYPGGNSGNIIFFCSGAATSIEGQLFYARAGTTVVNNPSYTGPLPSSTTLGGVILPVNWLSFDAIKQGNDGLLNWRVAGEDATQLYELQRSSNNTNFTPVATINKSANSGGSYKYTDAGITNLGASILYYRVKQVDINGKISYSDTRLLRLDFKNGQINIYPNPVKDGFYVSVPFANPDNRKVKLNLSNTGGQVISSKEITMLQATNYYFDIKNKTLAAGNYNLQIIFEDKVMETKPLYISQ